MGFDWCRELHGAGRQNADGECAVRLRCCRPVILLVKPLFEQPPEEINKTVLQ